MHRGLAEDRLALGLDQREAVELQGMDLGVSDLDGELRGALEPQDDVSFDAHRAERSREPGQQDAARGNVAHVSGLHRRRVPSR